VSIDEAALAAEILARHGVTTAQRLASIGIGRRSTDRLIREGRLKRAGRGVLLSASWTYTLEHRMAAACAITRGVVKFPTAGVAWGLRKSPRTPEIHVWVLESRRVGPVPDVRIHLTGHLPESDIVRREDGIDITSPPRTAFDAAAVLELDDLESLVEHGIDRGYFVIPTLSRMSRDAGRRGRPGSSRFAAVLASRPAWRRPVRSDHELRLERAMRRRGFPPLVREHRLVLLDGEVIHPDLGVPQDGFFVEVDHLTWHARRGTSANDRRRDLKASASGFHIERVTDLALDDDLEATIEQLWIAWRRLVASAASSFS